MVYYRNASVPKYGRDSWVFTLHLMYLFRCKVKGPGRQQALAVYLLTGQTVQGRMRIGCKKEGWMKTTHAGVP